MLERDKALHHDKELCREKQKRTSPLSREGLRIGCSLPARSNCSRVQHEEPKLYWTGE